MRQSQHKLHRSSAKIFNNEEFTQKCSLPYRDYEYDEIQGHNDINFDLAVLSFLTDQTSIISTPFIVGLNHPDIRVIHYMVNHVLFPKKSNSSHINK